MLREVPPGLATSRLFFLRAATAVAAFAYATFSIAQSPSTSPPAAPPPETQQAVPAPAPDAQQPAPAGEPSATPAPDPAQALGPSKPGEHAGLPTATESRDAVVTEDQLKQQFVGKTFYLRGGYLDNMLHFNQMGELAGSSPKASYTLSLVQIDRVKVEKHRVELEGVRYGLHFLGALGTEDQGVNVDKVKLTSKKKPLKITIDRELVVTPKKQKPEKADKKKGNEMKPALAAKTQPQPAVTFSVSKADASRTLRTALDRIFSSGIDDRMVSTLPDYWQLYFKAIAEKADYKPSDPAVLRLNQVDKKPRLTMAFEPPSNEYAQNNGVVGMSMYHVVVGADGKPQEVAVGRPIGFGLDENAVESIRKASFEPGMKDGKPVPVEVDLTVQFRIYSKRTAAGASDSSKTESAPESKQPTLPGPYSVNLPQPTQQTQPQ